MLSESSWASDSTIKTPSSVPATTRSSSEFSISWIVGFATSCPSIYPTLAEPKVPATGRPEIANAAPVAYIAIISGSTTLSYDRTVNVT